MKLRTYFAGLIALFAATALAGVLYARHESQQNARTEALNDAEFAARSAAKVFGEGVTILQDALGGLSTDPKLPTLLAHPSQCELSWAQVGAFPSGHLDIARPDGRIVCTSLRPAGGRDRSYAGQPWLARARSARQLLAPVHDPVTGRPVALLTVRSTAGWQLRSSTSTRWDRAWPCSSPDPRTSATSSRPRTAGLCSPDPRSRPGRAG
ncbi:MAG TPA: PDC sensor domain-containing protein [Solirubrobacteraceae bacterium]|nr:PDC sensor domain-containing protein [Solirubrobacteraceae bacterium]